MKQTLNMWQQLSVNLRYGYSARRATQTMLASRSLPRLGNTNIQGKFTGCLFGTKHLTSVVRMKYKKIYLLLM